MEADRLTVGPSIRIVTRQGDSNALSDALLNTVTRIGLPSAATLAVCVLGYALIQIQVRLEETHLARLHGDAYRQYQVKVRRWL